MTDDKKVYIVTAIPDEKNGEPRWPRPFGMFENVEDLFEFIEENDASAFHEYYYTFLVVESYSLNQYSPIAEVIRWYEIDRENDWSKWIRLDKTPEQFEKICNFAM